MKPNIQTNLQKAYTKFTVDDSVIDWLRQSTEIIFDITQRAVQENRFEVVASALKNIYQIADDYIKARIEYSTEQDRFLTYLDEKLIDTKNQVKSDTHPKIMLSIALTARNIALSTLDIKPIRSMFGENYMPIGFINLLSDICLSREILKDTSYAPMTTIDYLVDIGKKAIGKGFPRTVGLITDKLGEISRVTTKLHFLFADSVAGKSNWALAALLDYLLINQEKSNLVIEHDAKSALDEINKSIKTYLEDDYRYTLRSNIKPFFGPMSVQEHGLASVFIRPLQSSLKEQYLWIYFEVLDDFLMELNQNIMLAMDKSKYIDVKDILDHIYMIGIVLVGFIKKQKDIRLKEKALGIFKNRFSYPFVNAISMSFKRDERGYTIFDDDYMQSFFSLIGITFYENLNDVYSEVLEDWLTKIIDIIRKHKNNLVDIHEGHKFPRHDTISLLTDLYRYLRLTGTWINKYLPKSKLLNIVLFEIKTQPSETISTGFMGTEQLYPTELTFNRWIIQRPYLPFNPQYFLILDQTLDNLDIKKDFETKIKKFKAK